MKQQKSSRIAVLRSGMENNRNSKIKKKERKRSFINEYLTFMLSRMNGSSVIKRAPLHTLFRRVKSAVMSVEAAAAVPVFLIGMITMFSFMDIYRLETVHLMKVCSQVKESALAAYGGGSEEVTVSEAFGFRPPVRFFPLPQVSLHSTVTAHAWTGSSSGGLTGASHGGEDQHMVYMAKNGQVFHRNLNCTYLHLSIRQASGSSVDGLRNRYGERYHACENCSYGQAPAAAVYVTDTGNRYHNLGSCSSLRRTVRMVSENDAGARPCSRCG